MMSRTTLRSILITGTLCIIGIMCTQVYWVAKNYELKEKETDLQIKAILKNVAQSILVYNKNTSPLIDPVVQLDENRYVTKVNDRIDPALLEALLKREFLKWGLKTDMIYGIYDCQSGRIEDSGYVTFAAPLHPYTYAAPAVNGWNYTNYYFYIELPDKESLLLGSIRLYIWSTLVLLVIVAFFAYLLHVVLKQRRLSEIQKDFINNMTHEFRTPLSTILISSRAMKDPDMPAQPQRLVRYASIIEMEAQRLNLHVERVLQMARLDKEHIQLQLELIDVSALLQEAIDTFNASFAIKKFEITLHSLTEQSLLVQADRLHLLSVLLNLLDNALKYSPLHPKIGVTVFSEKRRVVIQVSDNGIGIAPELQRKIFEPFYRVPSGLVHDVKGFGLGLNYVKNIVEAHQGAVSISSKLHVGTTFSLFLPYCNE